MCSPGNSRAPQEHDPVSPEPCEGPRSPQCVATHPWVLEGGELGAMAGQQAAPAPSRKHRPVEFSAFLGFPRLFLSTE